MRLSPNVQTAIIAAAVALMVAAAPAMAAVIADFAKNSHKVDGIHAVKSSAPKAKRAKRLVATDAKGYLPNNIIRKASSSAKADRSTTADVAANALKLSGLTSGNLGVRVWSYHRDVAVSSDGCYAACDTSSVDKNTITLDAGSYNIQAKATVYNTNTGEEKVDCYLMAGDDYDTVALTLGAGWYSPVGLNTVHTFSGSGNVRFECQEFSHTLLTNTQTMVSMVRITVTKAGSLSDTALP